MEQLACCLGDTLTQGSVRARDRQSRTFCCKSLLLLNSILYDKMKGLTEMIAAHVLCR